jgi:putative membrane protein
VTNENLTRLSHVWALVVFTAFGVAALANDTSAKTITSQNSNSTSSQTRTSGEQEKTSKTSNVRTSSSSSLAKQDKNFLMEAAMGGMMEVELGRLAVTQGTSEAVKQFGQRMIDDHSKANSELTELAQTKGLALPTELSAKHRADVTKMSKLSGAAFDRAYSKDMLSDHMKDVAAFERAGTSASDTDVKEFAAKTLPTLKEHLELAKTLNGTKSTGMKTAATKPKP